MDTCDGLNQTMQYLRVRKLKMETPESTRASPPSGRVGASIDPTDAHPHVPIHLRDQKFLHFEHDGEVSQFSSLPFRLATATPPGFHQAGEGSKTDGTVKRDTNPRLLGLAH